MIKLVRIDYRLIHGQVAMAWTPAVGADCLLVADDAAARDSVRATTLRLARPACCKLVIKRVEDAIRALNSGITDTYALLIVVESVADAHRLAMGCDRITSINFGGSEPHAGAERRLTPMTPVSRHDIQLLRELMDRGIEVEIRQVPGDRKLLVKDLLS